jgi:hypothetical protein
MTYLTRPDVLGGPQRSCRCRIAPAFLRPADRRKKDPAACYKRARDLEAVFASFAVDERPELDGLLERLSPGCRLGVRLNMYRLTCIAINIRMGQ